MTSLKVGEWDQSIEAHYEDDTYVKSGHTRQDLVAQYEGVEMARGSSRFLPWRPNTVFFYCSEGGSQQWTLPRRFPSDRLSVTAIYPEGERSLPELVAEGRVVRFESEAGVPLRFEAQ